MKDWIKELCPEIDDWQAELIAEQCQQGIDAEREACAKVLDWNREMCQPNGTLDTVLHACAAAIRARGNT